MKKLLAAGMLTALVAGGAAFAQAPTVYTWTGYGVNVPGSSKCPTYKMNIEVTVTGKAVKGVFQQEGRDQRQVQDQIPRRRGVADVATMRTVLTAYSCSSFAVLCRGEKLSGPRITISPPCLEKCERAITPFTSDAARNASPPRVALKSTIKRVAPAASALSKTRCMNAPTDSSPLDRTRAN